MKRLRTKAKFARQLANKISPTDEVLSGNQES